MRRFLSFLFVVLAVSILDGAIVGASSERPAPLPREKAVAIPEMEFYVVRGEPDACGQGCNEWIAAEGRIDLGAAKRLHRLLAELSPRRPPIYFHSPGGAVSGSIALGRLIRDRLLEVGVAHTVPLGCERDKPPELSCEAQKRSGQELRADFDPTSAMCNSACVLALVGGVVRFIPPGA